MGFRDTLVLGLRTAVKAVLSTSSVSAAQKVSGNPVVEPITPTPSYRTREVEAESNGHRGRPFASIRPISYSAWDVGDDERALEQAEQGRLQFAVQLCEAIEADGVASGLLTTRSAGLLRLPLTVTGPKNLVTKLVGDGKDKRGGIFWKMFPHAALARIIRMGILLGAGIGYFVDVDGVPVLHVIEHQYLFQVKDGRGQWRLYYQTQEGDVEVTPGKNGWFVFAPYGWERFWIYGSWRAVGKFWLAKLVAVDQRTTWGAKLARGIMWVEAPNSSTTAERDGVVEVLANSIAPPVIAMLQGWKLNNIDVQGRGFEVWKDGKEDANNEIRMALSGQLVTGGGQSLGFGSGNIFADIAGSFIDNDAGALAEAIHYHGLVPMAEEAGESEAPWAEWDTVNPNEKEALGKALKAYGEGVSAAAKGHVDAGSDVKLNLPAYAEKMGVDLETTEQEEDDEDAVLVSGIKARIEYPEGSVRSGTGPDGMPWHTLMVGAGYGEIVGTTGEDGEALDAYVGPFGLAKNAFVLEQLDIHGARDEFKVFLGFASLDHAQQTYRRLGRADLEGSWIEIPASLLAGMIRVDVGAFPSTDGAQEQNKPELPASTQDKPQQVEPVAPESNEAIDPPTDAEAEQLAEEMTLHKIDRCEHGRVNECLKCGIERVRGVLLGPDGKPAGWKIAWRAIKRQASESVAASKGDNKIFAYHIDKDAVTVHEVRKSLDLDTDPRVGDMFPSEWMAYLEQKRREMFPDLDGSKPIAADEES